MAGYHIAEIKRGKYGELSKIQEELDEAVDAEKQVNPLMVLLELSDMMLAIEGYLKKQKYNIDLTDLIVMAHATRRAFESGERKPHD